MSTINNISLYIPHIFDNFTKDYVVSVFEKCGIGKVKHIDFVSKLGKDGKTFNAAYIHFEHWFENSVAARFQERVLDEKKEARLVYDDPWYWIVLENKARKFIPGDRKPRIDLGGDVESLSQEMSLEKSCVKLEKEFNMVVEDEAANLAATNEFFKSNGMSVEEEDFAAKILDELAECQLAMEEDFGMQEDFGLEEDFEMAECEALMQEDDQHLASFDSRYVQQLEQENMAIRMQLSQLQGALFTEQTRSQTLFETIRIFSQEK